MPLHSWSDVDIYTGRTDIGTDEAGVLADLRVWYSESMFKDKEDLLFQFLHIGLPYGTSQLIRRCYRQHYNDKNYTVFDAVLEVLKENGQVGCLALFLQGNDRAFENII